MKLKKLSWSGNRQSKKKAVDGSPTKGRGLRFSPRKKSSDAKKDSNATNENAQAILSKPEEDPACLLFEDNSAEDEKDTENIITQALAVEVPPCRDPTAPQHDAEQLNASETPASPCTPTKRFPMQEIMIDPKTVPPSPMREPNVNIMADPTMNKRLLDDYTPGMYRNFQDNHCIGDPVGDIAMQRQLMDAQRLVRIILGKSLKADEDFLHPNSILQAIRSFALMKAELIALRKKQETLDGDPPAILQALGSPAATTPSTARTGVFFPNDNGLEPPIIQKSPVLSPLTELDRAKQTIQRLQNELQTAQETIEDLRIKSRPCVSPTSNGDSPQVHKETVRKKLNLYCETVPPSMEEEMRQSLDESDRQSESEGIETQSKTSSTNIVATILVDAS